MIRASETHIRQVCSIRSGILATITLVFAAACTISAAPQDFIAPSGVPAAAFPKPDRPVADIVSPIWHDEKERDDADEAGQLVRLLGIKSGMTVADIGAGSGYYVARLSPIVGSRAWRRSELNPAGVLRSSGDFAQSVPQLAGEVQSRPTHGAQAAVPPREPKSPL